MGVVVRKKAKVYIGIAVAIACLPLNAPASEVSPPAPAERPRIGLIPILLPVREIDFPEGDVWVAVPMTVQGFVCPLPVMGIGIRLGQEHSIFERDLDLHVVRAREIAIRNRSVRQCAHTPFSKTLWDSPLTRQRT